MGDLNLLEVVLLVASILPLVALFQVFDGLSGVTAGIFRAMGKQACRDLFACPSVLTKLFSIVYGGVIKSEVRQLCQIVWLELTGCTVHIMWLVSQNHAVVYM